ncbi:hypothetical protein EJ08DRAFT_311398 [Tothia fuscella]|uniref:Lysozyme n=1 Tax=Tothia fuscella TaxID=1048955 RepID=A0A9P4TWR6_9PEZI|nr:hypothetical protein EJ08DRAFT_311398 [Tothia fuscella]
MKILTSLVFIASAATVFADLKGFDISQAQSTSFWSCMRNNGYNKVLIRAYFQSCGSKGGDIDPNFIKSYNAARNAGFKAPDEIDAYMFPCTGTQDNAKCKSPQSQIDQLLNMFATNNVQIHRIWFDVEPGNSQCNAWNFAKDKNLEIARQWTAALKKTGLKWGVYANGSFASLLFTLLT